MAGTTAERRGRRMVEVILVLYLAAFAILAWTWTTRDVALQMRVAGAGVGLLYFVGIWHSAMVRGARQTVAYFALAGVVSFFVEFMGNGYGWFFGVYHYTESLGPRLGGVPVLIVVVWGTISYASYSVAEGMTGLAGQELGATWGSRIGWSALLGLASGLLAAAFDLMADPLAVSGLWMKVLGWKPWWWWAGGGYLPELQVWKGAGGIPYENFAGWVGVPGFIVLVFCLVFRRPVRVEGPALRAVPLLIYGYLYVTMAGGLFLMGWLDPGLRQALLIGTFTMGPVFVVGLARLARERSRA